MQYVILVVRFSAMAWNILVDCCFSNDEKFKYLMFRWLKILRIRIVELFKYYSGCPITPDYRHSYTSQIRLPIDGLGYIGKNDSKYPNIDSVDGDFMILLMNLNHELIR